MAEARKSPEGLLLVNKTPGMTSHDVVDLVRHRLNVRRVGHAGTLDPLAEGLLIILVGKYTKFFPRFVAFDKEYFGVLKLGETTTTGDSEGKVLTTASYEDIAAGQIEEAFSRFRGEYDQVPPMVSAVRVGGKRLYKLARKGIEVKRKARRITIHKLTVERIGLPLIEFYVKCSKGTYVRKLAEDIGQILGCGAHIVKIKRLAIGPFHLDEAVDLEAIDESCLKTITPW